MNKLFITFESVNKTYGKGEASQKAADHVSFTIGEGEFVVILGPSGAGKSTVLNILGGMDRPDSGTVTVAASRIDQMTEKQLSVYRAEKVGFIFQFYNLLPSLTARENVALTKSIVGHAMDPAEALQAVGLSEVSFAAFRRRTAACLHRKSHCQTSGDPARGRADRRARLGDRRQGSFSSP